MSVHADKDDVTGEENVHCDHVGGGLKTGHPPTTATSGRDRGQWCQWPTSLMYPPASLYTHTAWPGTTHTHTFNIILLYT